MGRNETRAAVRIFAHRAGVGYVSISAGEGRRTLADVGGKKRVKQGEVMAVRDPDATCKGGWRCENS